MLAAGANCSAYRAGCCRCQRAELPGLPSLESPKTALQELQKMLQACKACWDHQISRSIREMQERLEQRSSSRNPNWGRTIYTINFPWWMCSKRSEYLGISLVRSRASWTRHTDDLSHITEASSDLNGTRSLLELYKASQVSISEDELVLDSIGTWSGRLLEKQLSSRALQRIPLLREVEHALNSPFYTTLDRLEHKWNIEQPDAMEHHILHLPRQTNQDLLALGVMDFTTSQTIYQQELELLDSWVKESRLDQLPFARMKLTYFYLSAAGTMFSQELSDARIFWAMNGVLTTVVDDFFDVGGSKEELENLTTLVEMWERHEETKYYSKQVEIVFSAIYSSVNQLGAKASAVQGRDVTGHLVEIWRDLLRNMMTEVEWRECSYVPTPQEYMENAVVTFALGPVVLPALYFVGPKIMESIITDTEYVELFRLMSTCGRLLNDVQTYEREYSEGKLNSVSLLVLQSGGSLTIPEARRELQKPIDICKRDLLRLVLGRDSVVPRPCKELFWNMCKTCYFFYSRGDAFSSPEEKAGAVNAVIHEPLQLPCSLRPLSHPSAL